MGLGENLRYLCSFQHSIAGVCRELSINRQQFNRYLNGENCPRGYNLKRICDYFQVTESQLSMPHKEFRKAYETEPTPADFKPVSTALEILNEKTGSQLDKYLGYYYEYYYSMYSPSHILRGLVCLKKVGDTVYYERFERLIEDDDSGKASYCHYKGVALFLNERIFMIDYESITNNEVAEIILFPSFKQRVSLLEGTITGVSASTFRQPLSRHYVLEYIGPDVNLRQKLRECFLYEPDSELIPESVKSLLSMPLD